MQKKNNNKNKVRLSKDIIPLNYELTLQPDLENFSFEGFETITISISKPTKVITLHSKDLEIDTVSVEINKKTKVFANKISYDTKSETASFIFKEIIPKGKVKLNLVFKGILNDKMRGFYRSSYDVDGKIHNMATTQFEATDARRAFPCFDEPAQKAVFHVSLIVPKGKTAISNTLPVSVSEHSSGFEILKFSPTPKMSTYLLAFIIGDFEYLEQKSKNGVLVRVYTTPGKKHQAEFALSCGVKMLEFYEEYFDIKYPLDTLDMIAIPDFASGAMENWGAITYRESALLIDSLHSSVSAKQWVALVIAHELAHQWFGNLVTMEWWTHLWLNEGFASYIEYLAVDKMFPHWDIWTQFATHDLGVALKLDSLKHTHPIEITVHHPSEIGEIFDEVSYSKGASIIRMLADYLGEENFRNGLRYYLKKHSYKNTETIHLWEAFEKVSKKHKGLISNMMSKWTSLDGYPVIKTKIIQNKIELTQERFFASPISKLNNKKNTVWPVPIIYGNYNSLEKVLFKEKKTLLIAPSSWIKLNLGETGFFRTAYSKDLLERLIGPVQNKDLKPIDRLGIVRDLFALAEAGTIPTSYALDFLKAYQSNSNSEGEDNYTVWQEISSGLSKIEHLLAKTKSIENLNLLSIKLFYPLLQRLTWEKQEGEKHTDSLLRSLAIARLGRAGHKETIQKAQSLCKMVQEGMHINPDIKGAIYSVVASAGGIKEYNAFIKQYKNETLHEEKNRIGYALGDFKDDKILCDVVNFAFSDNVRIQDTISILSSVAMNPFGRDIWFKSLKKNWTIIISRYGEGGYTLSRMVKAINTSAEEKHLKLFTDFFKQNDAPGALRSIEQVKERLESNIAWLKRDRKSITKFLNQSFKE